MKSQLTVVPKMDAGGRRSSSKKRGFEPVSKADYLMKTKTQERVYNGDSLIGARVTSQSVHC